MNSDYDTFLCHNSSDKPEARQLKEVLQQRGFTVWFDEDELTPGRLWQPLLVQGLQAAGSVIVAIGSSGIGPWHGEELQMALSIAATSKRPVIPVLLPGSPNTSINESFLANRTWVDFREGMSVKELSKLAWGITGEKPSIIDSLPTVPNANASRWILVAGSGGATPRPKKMTELCHRLGTELAIAGFSLVTGGWDGVDHDVAGTFARRLQAKGQSLSGRLVQVMKRHATPAFSVGRLVSEGSDDDAWRHSVKRADAVVLIGGLGGTKTTGELAFALGRPVFPIPDSRGTMGLHADAYRFYYDSVQSWPRNPAAKHLSLEQFEQLAAPAPGVVSDLLSLLKAALNTDDAKVNGT